MTTEKSILLAAVEGGGTSFLLTIATLLDDNSSSITNDDMIMIPHTPFRILHQKSIPTTTPQETLSQSASFFQQNKPSTKTHYDALGIATFGPVGVNLRKNPETYGTILSGSPKQEWRNVDILTPILNACSHQGSKPFYKVDTDVNAPALAEFLYQTRILKNDISSLAYITVGTGIGVGLIVNSHPVHGLMHPEAGHVPISPLVLRNTSETDDDDDDLGYSWGDKSPFFGKNTVEGTACTVALTERLSRLSCTDHTSTTNHDTNINTTSTTSEPQTKVQKTIHTNNDRSQLKHLSDDHIIWDYAANALANLCVSCVLMTSVEKIILGGGVMNRTILYNKIRNRTKELLNGYIDFKELTTDAGLKDFIGPSVWDASLGYGYGPGLVGALTLAKNAYEEGISKD